MLNNLLSNAFKFTESGGVTLQLALATRGWDPDNESLKRAQAVVAFSVIDTGIGIPEDKQAIIFEAFQQADMTTARQYGGTGLGLSISREIARLLGGEIRLTSTPGSGSTFTLYLPASYQAPTRAARWSDAMEAPPVERPSAVNGPSTMNGPSTVDNSPALLADAEEALAENVGADDRGAIQPHDRVLLIVEDDVQFARIVLDMAHERGFKGLIAAQGAAGLALARKYKPAAITLDLRLPDMDGRRLLDMLKHDPNTRHIPVHIVSATDVWQRGLQLGAIAHLKKPVSREELDEALDELLGFAARPVKSLLVVEDDRTQGSAIVELIGNGDVQTTVVQNGADALAQLATQTFDCVVVDLGLPDMSGFDLIRRIKTEAQSPRVPIIVYTGRELTPKEDTELAQLAETVIVKDASSPQRLLDETALFLHRVQANLPESTRRALEEIHDSDPLLVGKKVLIVDDDIRNIFALTSALERHRMDVVHAENGKDGIDLLNQTDGVDLVLMDVMMPEMDGLETMRRIRAVPQFASLPIIALTAKAMKGDRDQCTEAGASDYITKPVDVEQLLSVLRVWLYR